MKTFWQNRRASVVVLWFLILIFSLVGCDGRNFIKIMDGEKPLANADVKARCYTSADAESGEPFEDFKTNEEGFLMRGEALASQTSCPFITVLHEVEQGHDGKYSIYERNWSPTNNPEEGRETTENPIQVGDDSHPPLILFNPTVSLAWEVSGEYADDLQNAFTGMKSPLDDLIGAAEFLYDVTEGQATFGEVTFFDNGENWDSADIRILASNDFRPSAFVGGIVKSTTNDASGKPVFHPRAIFLGRHWDQTGPSGKGTWGDKDGYRTIVHEWAHYALFLRDSYINGDGSINECELKSGEASVMANQYETSEFWDIDEHGPHVDTCRDTPQWIAYGRSDWDTLIGWGEFLSADHSLAVPERPFHTDDELNLAVVGQPNINASAIATSVADHESRLIEPTIPVQIDQETLPRIQEMQETTAFFAHVYAMRDDWVLPSQITHQGTVVSDFQNLINNGGVLGEIKLLGVQCDDFLYISIDYYNGGVNQPSGRLTYPLELQVHNVTEMCNGDFQPTLGATIDNWDASLDGVYEIDVANQQLLINWEIANGGNPEIQMCFPGDGCQPLPGSAIEFAVEDIPLYAIVRAVAPGAGQIVRWVLDGGGVGPAHVTGHSPIVDGEVVANLGISVQDYIDKYGEEVLPCSRIFVMPSANYQATRQQGRTVVGLPTDIDILLLPPDAPSGTTCSSVAASQIPINITSFYDRFDLSQFTDIEPEQLRFSSLLDDGSQEIVNQINGDANFWGPQLVTTQTSTFAVVLETP